MFLDDTVPNLMYAAAHRDIEHGDEPECQHAMNGPGAAVLRISASRLDLAEPGSRSTEPTILLSLVATAARRVYPPEFAASGLTPAEQEIALAYATGGSIKSIALARGRSVETIRTHLKTAMSKLGLHRQVELALLVTRAH